jgi:hypothetical protein
MIISDRYRRFTLRYTFPICCLSLLSAVWVGFFEQNFDVYNLFLSIGFSIIGIALSYLSISMIRSAAITEEGLHIDEQTIPWGDIVKIRTSWFLLYRVDTAELSYYFAPSGFLFTFFGLILWGDEMYGVFMERGYLQNSAFNY